MTALSRAPIRAAIAALFTAELTGSGKPSQAVYEQGNPGWQHEAPVVIVRSSGSRRRGKFVGGSKGQNDFAFALQIYVPDAKPDGTWTDDQAQDALDELEARAADVVLANRRTADWLYLDWDNDYSAAESGIILNGFTYKRETIILTTMVYDS